MLDDFFKAADEVFVLERVDHFDVDLKDACEMR